MMGNRRVWAALFVVAAGGGGIAVAACGSDDAAGITVPTEGGTDAPITPPTGTTTTPPPPPPPPPSDAGPADAAPDAAEARALWGFVDYCEDGTDAGCSRLDKCPSYEGGIAAQDCPKPSARCLNPTGRPDSGLSDRVFACISLATPAWEVNRLCDFEPCDDVDAAACPDFDSGGIVGQTCERARTRCRNNSRVFICQPNNALVNTFNGYCDAGMGTPKCSESADACAPIDGGGIAAGACATEHERCIAGGDKIFVCAQR